MTYNDDSSRPNKTAAQTRKNIMTVLHRIGPIMGQSRGDYLATMLKEEEFADYNRRSRTHISGLCYDLVRKGHLKAVMGGEKGRTIHCLALASQPWTFGPQQQQPPAPVAANDDGDVATMIADAWWTKMTVEFTALTTTIAELEAKLDERNQEIAELRSQVEELTAPPVASGRPENYEAMVEAARRPLSTVRTPAGNLPSPRPAWDRIAHERDNGVKTP